MINENNKCASLLVNNGWEFNEGANAYINRDLLAFDLSDTEIVCIDDTGDFLHLPMNVYSLLGVLIEYRQMPINYVSWER